MFNDALIKDDEPVPPVKAKIGLSLTSLLREGVEIVLSTGYTVPFHPDDDLPRRLLTTATIAFINKQGEDEGNDEGYEMEFEDLGDKGGKRFARTIDLTKIQDVFLLNLLTKYKVAYSIQPV